MIKTVCQQVLRQSVMLLLLLGGVTYLVASWVDQQIFSPPRKQLHNFHLQRLNNPAEFGLRIRQHTCIDGKVPCILVEPDTDAGPGKRGAVLREQMAERGIKLPPYGETRATLVMLHGRNGRKERLLAVAERFAAVGFRCLIADLPAHGESKIERLSFGGSEFERQLPARVLADMKQHFNLPDEPLALWGMSMGGAFAVSAASAHDAPWKALIVVSSFAALDEVLVDYLPPKYTRYAKEIIALLDTVRWLQGKPAVSDIRPEQWAQQVSIPTLAVHGDYDVFVSIEQGERLFNSVNSETKQWIAVPDAGHRNVLSTPMQVYATMSEWLLEVLSCKDC